MYRLSCVRLHFPRWEIRLLSLFFKQSLAVGLYEVLHCFGFSISSNGTNRKNCSAWRLEVCGVCDTDNIRKPQFIKSRIRTTLSWVNGQWVISLCSANLACLMLKHIYYGIHYNLTNSDFKFCLLAELYGKTDTFCSRSNFLGKKI